MAIQHSGTALDIHTAATVRPKQHPMFETRFSTVVDRTPAPRPEHTTSPPPGPASWAPPDPAQRSPVGEPANQAVPSADAATTEPSPTSNEIAKSGEIHRATTGVTNEASVTAELSLAPKHPNERAALRTGTVLALLAAMIAIIVIGGIGIGVGRNGSEEAADGVAGPTAADSRPTADSVRSGVEAYRFQVIEAVDVSTPQAERRGLAIEVPHFPIERDRLMATLDAAILGLAGEAQAVTVRVHHDRREYTPAAFGVWVWAPDGQWDRAAEGDPSTWDGYSWSAEFEPQKIADPDRCQPLTDEELTVMGVFWPRVWATNQPNAAIRSDVAATLGISLDQFAEIEAKNLAWNDC